MNVTVLVETGNDLESNIIIYQQKVCCYCSSFVFSNSENLQKTAIEITFITAFKRNKNSQFLEFDIQREAFESSLHTIIFNFFSVTVSSKKTDTFLIPNCLLSKTKTWLVTKLSTLKCLVERSAEVGRTYQIFIEGFVYIQRWKVCKQFNTYFSKSLILCFTFCYSVKMLSYIFGKFSFPWRSKGAVINLNNNNSQNRSYIKNNPNIKSIQFWNDAIFHCVKQI